MDHIYLDSSSTTRLCPVVAEKMRNAAETIWGNPSSLHSAGFAAEKLIDAARIQILNALGVKMSSPKQLIFCGSGTEANNLAIFGSAYAKERNRGGKIITTDSEHPSVLEPLKKLESEGFDIIKIPTRGGVLDFGALETALSDGDGIFLVTIMLVNNETGALYDVKRAFNMVKKHNPNIITHTDAVQGFMKTEFSPVTLQADLITISAHKINGPKGIGALYVNTDILKAKKLAPLILGGGQENGMRSGTENVPGIVGFGVAAEGCFDTQKMLAAKNYLLERLPAEVTPNLPQLAVPHILNIALPRIKSEVMLHFLASKNIYVSSGSACSSKKGDVSYALTAFGLDRSIAECSIRISFDNSIEHKLLDIFIRELENGVKTLARISGR